jgi:hypothetical protein
MQWNEKHQAAVPYYTASYYAYFFTSTNTADSLFCKKSGAQLLRLVLPLHMLVCQGLTCHLEGSNCWALNVIKAPHINIP